MAPQLLCPPEDPRGAHVSLPSPVPSPLPRSDERETHSLGSMEWEEQKLWKAPNLKSTSFLFACDNWVNYLNFPWNWVKEMESKIQSCAAEPQGYVLRNAS